MRPDPNDPYVQSWLRGETEGFRLGLKAGALLAIVTFILGVLVGFFLVGRML